MKKFLLITLLMMPIAAGFDDKTGEEFPRTVGTVWRSKTQLILTEPNGTEHRMDKGKQLLLFKAGAKLGDVVLRDRLLVTHLMSRHQLISALAAYEKEF